MKAAPASIPVVVDNAHANAQLAYGRSQSRTSRSAARSLWPLLGAYLRSQLVALLATAVDFAAMVALVEALHVHYLTATALGAFSGGVTAFLGNRHYSFLASHGRLAPQSLRYALVWIGSITLNVALVYAMTDGAALQYTWSKALTAIVVGAAFNFPLHRWYVFR